MKGFKPSDDFVSKVMKNVHDYENAQKVIIPLSQRLLASRLVRYALSSGGIVFGLWNLLRVYFSVFAPVICR